jgi:hypothetical protein
LNAAMRARATIRAAAFLLNGAVFLVGLGRLQGRLAPPDFIYVGLLLGAPAVSWLALVLGYRRRLDPEVGAKAAALLLNGFLLLFVIWLSARLDPDTRADEALWLALLFVAPPANALAIVPRWSAVTDAREPPLR